MEKTKKNHVTWNEENLGEIEANKPEELTLFYSAHFSDQTALSFREHRRAHYDEFLKVRELQRKCPFLEAKDMDKDEGSLTEGVKDIEIKEASPPKRTPANEA